MFFKFDHLTNRIKEQKVSFVGIVHHILQHYEASGDKNRQDILTANVYVENIYDKSRVTLFINHPNSIMMKEKLK